MAEKGNRNKNEGKIAKFTQIIRNQTVSYSMKK